MKLVKYFIGISFLLTSCSSIIKNNETIETVSNVDLNKYSGKWYEIASIPQVFQEGCICTTAEYTPMGDYVKVFNSCKNKDTNELKQADGKAFPEPDSNNSKLKVTFFEPFKADYWIIDRDDNYKYAVVSNPQKSTLWILSRTPRMKIADYQSVIAKLKNKNFDLNKLERTSQNCKDR